MASKDYIPRGLAAFDAWQLNFVDKVNLYISGWNLSVAALAEWDLLTATALKKKLVWDAAYAIVKTKEFTKAEERKMLDARRDYENGDRMNPLDTSLRLFIARHLRHNILVTDYQKEDCGLTVPDLIKTPVVPTNAKLGEPELAGSIKGMEHLMHKISVRVPGQESVAKEDGIEEISIFIAFTEGTNKNPPSHSEFKYDGEVVRGSYVRIFSDEQEGMRAWYYACRRSGGKQKIFGPPSAIWNGLIP